MFFVFKVINICHCFTISKAVPSCQKTVQENVKGIKFIKINLPVYAGMPARYAFQEVFVKYFALLKYNLLRSYFHPHSHFYPEI